MQKLNKFTVKVAYPDKWKDYSRLTITPESKGGKAVKGMRGNGGHDRAAFSADVAAEAISSATFVTGAPGHNAARVILDG